MNFGEVRSTVWNNIAKIYYRVQARTLIYKLCGQVLTRLCKNKKPRNEQSSSEDIMIQTTRTKNKFLSRAPAPTKVESGRFAKHWGYSVSLTLGVERGNAPTGTGVAMRSRKRSSSPIGIVTVITPSDPPLLIPHSPGPYWRTTFPPFRTIRLPSATWSSSSTVSISASCKMSKLVAGCNQHYPYSTRY